MNTPLPITSDDLNAYIDNSLEPERRSEVAARLAADAALREEYIELRATARLLSQLPDYTPRRSFQLGAEHRRPTPITAAPSKVVRLLPLVRQLSVAAALIFMVVAGALFFDINGDTDGDGAGSSLVGVTDSADHASEGAEDASEPPAAAEESDDILTDRGDAASAGDEPMDDLTALQDGANDGAAGAQADDDGDRSAWIWASVGLGVLAAALAGLWYMLARVGRPTRARSS